MMYGWNGSGWGAFWMVVSMVVFWGALIAVVAFIVRPGGERRSPEYRHEATEVLRRRYAAGEIHREEYEERLQVLEGSGRSRS